MAQARPLGMPIGLQPYTVRNEMAKDFEGTVDRARRGESIVLRRGGKDVTIVGKLLTMYRALAAAEELAKDGIDAEVIDPRTLVPLDKELLLESVKKTGRLVIVEEDNLTGGWAGELAAIAAEEAFFWLDAPVKRVSAPDVPPPFAPVMEQFYVPSLERVVAAVKALF